MSKAVPYLMFFVCLLVVAPVLYMTGCENPLAKKDNEVKKEEGKGTKDAKPEAKPAAKPDKPAVQVPDIGVLKARVSKEVHAGVLKYYAELSGGMNNRDALLAGWRIIMFSEESGLVISKLQVSKLPASAIPTAFSVSCQNYSDKLRHVLLDEFDWIASLEGVSEDTKYEMYMIACGEVNATAVSLVVQKLGPPQVETKPESIPIPNNGA